MSFRYSTNTNGQLCREVLKKLENPTTAKELVAHMAQLFDTEPSSIKDLVDETLSGGIRFGYIQKLKNKYYLIEGIIDGSLKKKKGNQDTLDMGAMRPSSPVKRKRIQNTLDMVAMRPSSPLKKKCNQYQYTSDMLAMRPSSPLKKKCNQYQYTSDMVAMRPSSPLKKKGNQDQYTSDMVAMRPSSPLKREDSQDTLDMSEIRSSKPYLLGYIENIKAELDDQKKQWLDDDGPSSSTSCVSQRSTKVLVPYKQLGLKKKHLSHKTRSKR